MLLLEQADWDEAPGDEAVKSILAEFDFINDPNTAQVIQLLEDEEDA